MRRSATIVLGTALALCAPLPAGARASSGPHHGVPCQHRHGHTILRRGAVRVFEQRGSEGTTAYGCLEGSTELVSLWETGPQVAPGFAEKGGSVVQVAARFVAVETTTSNQYESSQSLEVFDLRSGASYAIAGATEPIDQPPAQGPRLERFVLGQDGRAAALFAAYPPATGASSSTQSAPQPSGQVLELLGFHHLHRVLASGSPGSIPAASLSFHGSTVGWSEGGAQRTASG